MFVALKKHVPTSISTTGGTTWIFGIAYLDDIPCDEGMLPQALYKSYIANIIKGDRFTFYAGYVTSLAVVFSGSLIIRNYLSAAKFELLPQVIVPVTINESVIEKAVTSGAYSFNPKFISGFFIFEDLHCRYTVNSLIQINATKDIKPFVDADGYIKGEVISKSGRTYVFNYSAIVHHKVTKDCSILVDRADGISSPVILVTRTNKKNQPNVIRVPDGVLKDVKCPVCGKVIKVGANDNPIQCDDPHCLSHLYNDAVKMMATLGLPSLSYNSYKALVDSKKIICLTDLVNLPPCEDIEIRTTLANAMYSVIPISVVPNFDMLERFANRCNNSIETAMYYIQNPLRIQTDLDIVEPSVMRFAEWVTDPYNVASLSAIFERVKIDSRVQKFDGCPIFRGVTIAVTGKFKRGNLSEIEAILRSYAADVVSSIEPGQNIPDVVIIGSFNDGVSGQMIQKARIHGIPIQYEDDFFTKYDIDKDLQANLL